MSALSHGPYDASSALQLRSLSREALEALLAELATRGATSGAGGAVAVQAARLAGATPRLLELAQSPSHAVGVRALTALLKTEPGRLLGLLPELGPARRQVALRALSRLSANSLQGLATEELLSQTARSLKGASPELVERWWPRLRVPSTVATSLAWRLPQLTLRLILESPKSRWQPHELKKVVSVAVASSADAVLAFMAGCDKKAVARQPQIFLLILRGLAKKAPVQALQALQLLLPSTGTLTLPAQWGEVLRSCAVRGDAWPAALEVAVKLVQGDAAAAALLHPLRPKDPTACAHFSREQLGALVKQLGLLRVGDFLGVLGPRSSETQLEDALQFLVRSSSECPTNLAQWPQRSRRLLAQELEPKRPPEVAGGAPDQGFLDVLAWQPYRDVEERIKKRSSSSNAWARQAGLCALITCAGRDGPEAIQSALSFFEARLRNEQDSVRAAVLRQLTTVPLLSVRESHIGSLSQLLTYSMQAKGSSAESLEVWQALVEVLVASSVAQAAPSGPGATVLPLGPCGRFGLDVKSQLVAAGLWTHYNLTWETAVMQRLAREPTPEIVVAAFAWFVHSARPGLQALPKYCKVDTACSLLARWEAQRVGLVRELRHDFGDAFRSFDLLLQEIFGWAVQSIRNIGSFTGTQARGTLRFLLLEWPRGLQCQHVLEAQNEAVNILCRQLTSWWGSVVDGSFSGVPWHVSLALEFLQQAEARCLQKRNPALHSKLVLALCTNWDNQAEANRDQSATCMLRCAAGMCKSDAASQSLAPLLQRICDWRFSLDLPHDSEGRKCRKSTRRWELRTKLALRSQAEELLTRPKSARKLVVERWQRKGPDLQLELLCTSDVLLRSLLHAPRAWELLLPTNRSTHLRRLHSLVTDAGMPLHLLRKASTQPLFSWPDSLQQSFAEYWLRCKTSDEEIQLAQCRMILELPAVGVAELGQLVEDSAAVLATEDPGAAAALERGRTGLILDRLMPMLAGADLATEVAPLLSQQLGRGVSKQAARSFQRLVRRLCPSHAAQALQDALSRDLKVAERVALIRHLSDSNLCLDRSVFEPLLESLYDSHRDVGGAVLIALSNLGSTALLTRVCEGDASLYQLQVLLGHLNTHSCSDEAAGALTMLCQTPSLAKQALSALALWAQSRTSSTSATRISQVAKAASQALTSGRELWPWAWRCLLHLAQADPQPLHTAFRELSDDKSTISASARLRALAEVAQMEPGLQEKGLQDSLRSVAAMALKRSSWLAVRWGLPLWAMCVRWNEPSQVLESLKLLPPLDPVFLPTLLSVSSASLHQARAQIRLRETSQALLDEGSEPALVVLMAIVRCTPGSRPEDARAGDAASDCSDVSEDVDAMPAHPMPSDSAVPETRADGLLESLGHLCGTGPMPSDSAVPETRDALLESLGRSCATGSIALQLLLADTSM